MLRALCLGLLFVPAAARADPVQASYAAYAGGLNVMNLDASFDVAPTQYRARLNWRTAGAFSLAVSGGQETSVEGHFARGRAVPHRFYSGGTVRGEHRVTQMDYQGGQPVIRQLIPPVEKEREPVPAGSQANTIDTISAMAELIQKVNQTGRCEGSATTFDGRRLAVLQARTVAQEFLPPYSRSSFSGNALHCAFDGKILAGFRLDEDRQTQQREQHGDAWFASVTPGGPMIPIRISFHTRWFGDATMYLSDRR